MKTFIALLLAFSIPPAFADDLPAVTISGRTFPLSFEDTSLSSSARNLMAADVAAMWQSQPGSIVQAGTNGSERLFNPSRWGSPYQNGLDLPDCLVDVGTNRCLLVSHAVSDAYLQAFIFAEAHTNELLSLPAFVDALAPAALSNAPSSTLAALLLGEDEIGEGRRTSIVSDLTQMSFVRPSLLGFRMASGSEGFVPTGTLLVAVPCSERASGHWDLWAAAWIGGGWRLVPPQ